MIDIVMLTEVDVDDNAFHFNIYKTVDDSNTYDLLWKSLSG